MRINKWETIITLNFDIIPYPRSEGSVTGLIEQNLVKPALTYCYIIDLYLSAIKFKEGLFSLRQWINPPRRSNIKPYIKATCTEVNT